MNKTKNSTKPLSSLNQNERWFPRAMVMPTLIVMIVMTVYPLVFTLAYSFTDYNYLKGPGSANLIGFNNYKALFNNGYFRQAVANTVKFTLLAVVLEMVFGVLVAVFVNSLKKGKKTMRTLLLLPYLLPAVTVALSWRMMLSPNYGIINQALTALGLPVHNWFMDIKTAFNTILIIDVWQNVPFVFLLVYASLQSVSQNQYEAARIDGANAIQQFFNVTVPNIKGGLALCALMRTIDTFRLFEKVNILTGGGPAGTTSTITQFLYQYGISNLKFGFGSAGAIVMTLFVLILSSFYIRRLLKNDK
ncbi:sugar ABC transporter permease [Eubacteriales bacterium OttesenSCG-928-K08]|nr:sugar ABC transporter permease [Eubacteriales bacterium OttesenSCG-928-K08]